MKHYIYAYVDPRDSKVRYIGQGQNERWLAKHKHNEQYGVWPWLQRLKELGLEPLRFIVLEKLTKKQADSWEIDLIDLIGRQCEQTGPLLNLSKGGAGSSGVKRSAATRRKLSEARKGNTNSKGNVPWNKGKPRSEETKMKISESLKGKPSCNKGKTHTEKSRRNMSEACTHTEATKQKMSKSHKGKPSGRKGKTPWNKGKSLSEGHKLKISESRKGNTTCTSLQVPV